MSYNDPDVIAERDQRIAQLTREGKSANDIAGILGICARTVDRARKRLGISKPPTWTPMTADDLARAAAMLDDGCSPEEVGRTLGWHGQTIRAHFPDRCWTHQQVVAHSVLCRRMRETLR